MELRELLVAKSNELLRTPELSWAVEQIMGFPAHVRLIGGVLFALTLLFFLLFCLRGCWLWIKLRGAVRRLRASEATVPQLAKAFANDKLLSHLWQEYRHTLHEQRAVDAKTGSQEVIGIRATVPAETFFNSQAVVDGRLRVEFFKHLPGICTGLGIIGTFIGLINGLSAFRVSENAQEVRMSLEALLHGVFEAFLVSAAAITIAMSITFLEKWLISSLYKAVEKIAYHLDGLFETGAGEEYLARLVKSSEESATQARIIKDSLVADLKEILTDLTQRQVSAAQVANTELVQKMSDTLRLGLTDPLANIASAVQQVSADQGQAVTKLLTDVLAGFSQRLQDLFGGQISGINQLQIQTTEALRSVTDKLEQMVGNIDLAGQNAAGAMSAKVAEAISVMETRQAELNEKMSEFVGGIRDIVRDTQSDTSRTVQAALQDLGRNVADMITALHRQAEQASQTHREHGAMLAEQSSAAVGILSQKMEAVMVQIGGASQEFSNAVSALRSTTTTAIDKMNDGAELLLMAAKEFANAGVGVTGAFEGTKQTTAALTESARSVSAAALSLSDVVGDQRATRDALERILVEIRATVEVAKKEASLTSDILTRINSAADKLAQAEAEAETYLEKVGEVLAESHQQFAENMRTTIGEANTQFYNHLTQATALLRTGIMELEATIGAVETRQ